MQKIRFGIVGCGKIFDRHSEAIRANPEGAILHAVSDKNANRLEAIKNLYPEAKTYDSYEALLSDPDVDMVVICTPSGLHAQMAKEALQKNKHVLCEKPLAMHPDDLKELNALAKEKNLHLFEVKQNRYSPAIKILKNAITEGHLGRVLLGNATVRWNRTQEYYNQADWFGTLKMDGGVILNQAIHHIDLLCFMMGMPKSVMGIAEVLNHEIEAPDTALALVRFEDGSLGNLELTTCAAPTNIEGSITIMGDKGTIKVGGKSLDNFDIWQVENYEKPQIPDAQLSNHALLYKDIISLFAGENIGNLINAQEALKSLQLAQAIFDSAKEHREININPE